ncbi:MAG: hypothetical protein IJI16_06795 [Atopobiaceae bacterium]|nr:hypothetical protein [Atopobiaceae bacterium]MBQ6411640.1 hypothetical protein [Atopobiaceae bacterium]
MTDDIDLVPIRRPDHPVAPLSTARVIELGFDTDNMCRTATLALDPPLDGQATYTVEYSTTGADGLPGVTSDERGRMILELDAAILGYELAW